MRTALTLAFVLAGTSAYACNWNKTVKLEQSVASAEVVLEEKVEEAVTTSDADLDDTVEDAE